MFRIKKESFPIYKSIKSKFNQNSNVILYSNYTQCIPLVEGIFEKIRKHLNIPVKQWTETELSEMDNIDRAQEYSQLFNCISSSLINKKGCMNISNHLIFYNMYLIEVYFDPERLSCVDLEDDDIIELIYNPVFSGLFQNYTEFSINKLYQSIYDYVDSFDITNLQYIITKKENHV